MTHFVMSAVTLQSHILTHLKLPVRSGIRWCIDCIGVLDHWMGSQRCWCVSIENFSHDTNKHDFKCLRSKNSWTELHPSLFLTGFPEEQGSHAAIRWCSKGLNVCSKIHIVHILSTTTVLTVTNLVSSCHLLCSDWWQHHLLSPHMFSSTSTSDLRY